MSALKRMYDVVCVGAGPAGFAAAAKAAAEGLRAAVIDRRANPGGTCTAVGCIPSKALLYATHLLQMTREQVASRGVVLPSGQVGFDINRIQDVKDHTVDGHHKSLRKQLEDSGIDGFFETAAKLRSAHEIELSTGEVLTAKKTIIATGSKTIELPFLPFDEKRVFSSTGIVSLRRVPERLTILGAGVIGLELGSVFARMGTKVTLVEALTKIGSDFADPEVASRFQKAMEEKEGLEFRLGTRAVGAEFLPDGKSVAVDVRGPDGAQESITSDAVLVSVGRRADVSGLGLEAIGVETLPRGGIAVDSTLMTTVPDVYAIGDIVPGPMIAHKATMEASAVIDHIKGRPQTFEYDALPCVMYTQPEFAWCGRGEDALRADGVAFESFRFDYNGEMRDPLCDTLDGFLKVLVDKDTHAVLGVQAIGATAGDLVSEGTLAILNGTPIEQFGNCPHAHPFYKSFRTMLRSGKAY